MPVYNEEYGTDWGKVLPEIGNQISDVIKNRREKPGMGAQQALELASSNPDILKPENEQMLAQLLGANYTPEGVNAARKMAEGPFFQELVKGRVAQAGMPATQREGAEAQTGLTKATAGHTLATTSAIPATLQMEQDRLNIEAARVDNEKERNAIGIMEINVHAKTAAEQMANERLINNLNRQTAIRVAEINALGAYGGGGGGRGGAGATGEVTPDKVASAMNDAQKNAVEYMKLRPTLKGDAQKFMDQHFMLGQLALTASLMPHDKQAAVTVAAGLFGALGIEDPERATAMLRNMAALDQDPDNKKIYDTISQAIQDKQSGGAWSKVAKQFTSERSKINWGAVPGSKDYEAMRNTPFGALYPAYQWLKWGPGWGEQNKLPETTDITSVIKPLQ